MIHFNSTDFHLFSTDTIHSNAQQMYSSYRMFLPTKPTAFYTSKKAGTLHTGSPFLLQPFPNLTNPVL